MAQPTDVDHIIHRLYAASKAAKKRGEKLIAIGATLTGKPQTELAGLAADDFQDAQLMQEAADELGKLQP